MTTQHPPLRVTAYSPESQLRHPLKMARAMFADLRLAWELAVQYQCLMLI